MQTRKQMHPLAIATCIAYLLAVPVTMVILALIPDDHAGDVFPVAFIAHTVLWIGFLVIIIRDILRRWFPDPNGKAKWMAAILLFPPSVLGYLWKYERRKN